MSLPFFVLRVQLGQLNAPGGFAILRNATSRKFSISISLAAFICAICTPPWCI